MIILLYMLIHCVKLPKQDSTSIEEWKCYNLGLEHSTLEAQYFIGHCNFLTTLFALYLFVCGANMKTIGWNTEL